MEILELYYVCAFAEVGSFTRRARCRCFTQLIDVRYR